MIEEVILKKLLEDDRYFSTAFSYIQPDYFETITRFNIFKTIQKYFEQYNRQPSFDELSMYADNNMNFTEKEYNEFDGELKEIRTKKISMSEKTLNEETQKWLQSEGFRSKLNDAMESYVSGKWDRGQLLSLMEEMKDSLTLNFDNHLGMKFSEGKKERLFAYQNEIFRPTGFKPFDDMIGGGLTSKSIYVLMGGTNSGKSLTKVALSGIMAKAGWNVLYVTLELEEKKVMMRADASLLGLKMGDLLTISEKDYLEKFNCLPETMGEIIVKEYPTGSASAETIKRLLKELEIKDGFKPDVIFIDYLEIMGLAKPQKYINNSYGYVKGIAEEVRGLAMEYDIPLITSTQLNRCLDLKTKVLIQHNNEKFADVANWKYLKDIKVGDKIWGEKNWVKVKKIYPIIKQKAYKIKFHSKREIICSINHQFPTRNGLKTIQTGLKIDDEIPIYSSQNNDWCQIGVTMYDNILSIEEIEERELMDIEVSGNNLFYANRILTHNSGMDAGDDLNMTHQAESFGVPKTADFMMALYNVPNFTGELPEGATSCYRWKCLKTRFGENIGEIKSLGSDKSMMRIFAMDENADTSVQNEKYKVLVDEDTLI